MADVVLDRILRGFSDANVKPIRTVLVQYKLTEGAR